MAVEKQSETGALPEAHSCQGEGAAGHGKSAVIHAVAHIIKDDDKFLRSLAAKCLGGTRGKEAAEPLRALLEDTDPDVRCDAAAALGKIGDRESVPLLLRLLEDEDPFVRISAVESLAALCDTRVVEPLIECMKSEESFSYSMGELAGDYRCDIREKAAEALGKLRDHRAVQALIEVLKDEDADIMLGAVLPALVRSGERAGMDAVRAYLKDPAPYVRRKAVTALSHAGTQEAREAVELLREALIDEDGMVRTNAVEALANIGSEKDIISLVLLLKDGDEDVRAIAAVAVVKMGREKTLKHILPLLKDDSAYVRRKAVELVSAIGDADSVVPLIEALGDSSEAVRCEALLAIGRIGDKRAVPALAAVLKNRNRGKTLRESAVFSLANLKAPESFHPIAAIIKDKEEDAELRQMAMGLAGVFDERLVGESLSGLKDEQEEFIKKGFARLLRRYSGNESEALLQELLADKSEIVSIEAASSLAYRGNDSGMNLMSGALTGGKAPYAADICDAIKNIKTKAALDLLLECLKSGDAALRMSSIRSLGARGGEEAVPAIIGLLDDEEKDVGREAAAALGALGDRRALGPLAEALFDTERFGDLRMDIVTSMAGIDSDASVGLLVDVLNDKGKKAYYWIALEALTAVFEIHKEGSLQ